MEVEIKFKGDSLEDEYALKSILIAQEAQSAIHEALMLIRSRLKYGESLTDEEVRTLERIREELIPG